MASSAQPADRVGELHFWHVQFGNGGTVGLPIASANFNAAAAPEPASAVLLGLGLAGAAADTASDAGSARRAEIVPMPYHPRDRSGAFRPKLRDPGAWALFLRPAGCGSEQTSGGGLVGSSLTVPTHWCHQGRAGSPMLIFFITRRFRLMTGDLSCHI